MRGGMLGNLILVIISILLLVTIFGLFFGFNLLGLIMEWVSIGLSAVITFFAGIINAII
jgi:hypothetical protein